MNDLYDFGIRGRFAYFISAFLNERQFRVRVGNTYSNPHEQEMGAPQGCILSVTLFSVKINKIINSVSPGVECFLYVDYFCVCYRSKHMHTIERQLQQVLNNLSRWSNENGFKFSKLKTKCMHFCQSRKLHSDPEFTLDGARVEIVNEFKFLGLIFDSYTLSLDVLPFKVSYSDFKPLINVFIQDVWQISWCDPQTFCSEAGPWRVASRITVKSPRGNCFGPSTYWSYTFNALVPPQRRRSTSMCFL